MIAKLKGLVESGDEDGVILDVGGVGYLVFCSARTLSRLPVPGGAASLDIETHVREDHIHLYGFAERAERDWFRALTTVQGVGARVALAILSVLTPDQLSQAVAAQDKAAVARANGVGPKLAQRIVSELKDKAGSIALGPGAALSGAGTTAAAPGGGGTEAGEGVDPGAREDAVSALVNLGYGRSEAFTAVAKAARGIEGGADAAQLIRAGLKELSQ
ncbi:MAG: Holliday junction branch migration protein RuvA [Marivibrio sp.]|uniref:Holliday junction branch migration protein RuvA n=1 Tax=Marivibrio sp. TaxID=2039719 RepID=UPI0032EFA3C7